MLRPGDRFGQYRIESVLGEGGMGIVYRATDEQGGEVALKVVNPDLALDPEGNQGIEAARRLVREARTAGSLRHPNAIGVLDSGEIDGIPYIAMELARGRGLGQFMGDKRVPMDQRIDWLCAMARGLAAAHNQGIVHRDVKPENVMVCDDGWVKLFDFGVAKPIADPRASIDLTVVTHTGIVVGTPLYMAPEQVLGDKMDIRSDQYSWATVAFELLSGGIHPVSTTAESHLPVPFAILKGTPKHLREVAPTVPPRVADVVMRGLSRDPKARWPSMNDIVAALDAYFSHDNDADTTARRGMANPDSERTVAVASPVVSPAMLPTPKPAPAPAKQRRPAVVDDDSEVRQTLVYNQPHHDSVTVARPSPSFHDIGGREPETVAREPVKATREPPRKAPDSMRRPPVSVQTQRPRPSVDERADPSILGASNAPPASSHARPAVHEPMISAFPAAPYEPAGGPPSMRLAMQAAAAAAPPRRDWMKRLLLWIPVLFAAALAGYLTYLLWR